MHDHHRILLLKWARIIAPLLVFLPLAALAIYPALFALPDHIPAVPIRAGELAGKVSDAYHFHWDYWWIRHASANGLPIYNTNYIMTPFTSSLALHTLTPFWYPLWVLVEPLAGTAAAMDAILIAAMAFAGWTTYHLLREEGASVALALAGGAFFELSAIFITAVHWTNLNLMGWGWLPLMALVWRRAMTADGRGGLLWAALLGAGAWALLLIDLQYAIFSVFFLVPYTLITLWRMRRDRMSRTALTPLRSAIVYGLMAAIVAVALLWIAGPLQPLLAYDRSTLSPTPVERALPIVFPTCYFTRCETDVSLGYIILPLMGVSAFILWRRRRQDSWQTWLWLLIALLPLLLTLGTGTPLYPALHTALGGIFRYPERFAPLFLLPALLFVVKVWSPILGRVTRRQEWLIAPLMLLVIADARLFRPIPIMPLPAPYETYRSMAADNADYVVVDVPTAGMSGEGIAGDARWVQTQFYALLHEKRTSNGHLSRVDTWNFMYMETSDPMMAWLGQRRFLEPEAVAAQLAERLESWPIGALAVHEDWIDPVSLAEVTGFLNGQDALLCPPSREAMTLPTADFNSVHGALLTYRANWLGCTTSRTPPQANGTYTVDWGAPDDVGYIGWGWHPSEPVGGVSWRWLGAPPYSGADDMTMQTWRNRATLYVDLPPSAYTVTATVQAFHQPRLLSLAVNGVALGEAQQVGVDDLQAITFTLPADVVGDGTHLELAFSVDAALSPRDAGLSDDTRLLGVAVDQLTFTPE